MNPELIKIIPNISLIENVRDINESTRIEGDLKLSGSNARRFLFVYGDRFNVDLSQFRFKKYFPLESHFMPQCLKRFFRKKAITLGDLEQAIAYGRLNDAVLKKISDPTTPKPPRKKLYFKGEVRYGAEEIVIYILIGILLFIFSSIVAIFFT